MAKMNVDFEACKGCALCTTACPKKIVEISHEKLNAKGYYTAVCIDDEAWHCVCNVRDDVSRLCDHDNSGRR